LAVIEFRTASVVAAKAKLPTFVNECQSEGPLIITRNGKAVAVLLAAPSDEGDLERLFLSHSPQLHAILERSRKSFEEGGGLSHEEFWKAVEERAQQRKKEDAGNRERNKGKKKPV
jgi:prevent-host-death family protein